MSVFCLKKIEQPLLIGDILQKKRKQLKLTINNISQTTRIPVKYIKAIEKNHFDELPTAKALRLAYVKKYAAVLNLKTEKILQQFTQEAELEDYTTAHPHNHLKIKSINSIVFWIKRLILIGSVSVFIGYLIWQINGIIKPPDLAIYTPNDGFVSTDMSILIQGQTEKEVGLTINGQQTRTNDKGQFETKIDLSKGLNTITISATKKHGKTTTVTRNIIFKQDNHNLSLEKF